MMIPRPYLWLLLKTTRTKFTIKKDKSPALGRKSIRHQSSQTPKKIFYNTLVNALLEPKLLSWPQQSRNEQKQEEERQDSQGNSDIGRP